MTFQKSRVISNNKIAENVYTMRVSADTSQVLPGQFYMLKLLDATPILPRPISVCAIEEGVVEFCYLVVGVGTEKLAKLAPNDELMLTGSLGNGFDMPKINEYNNIALVSGGIGIAPFVEVAKRITSDFTLYSGFADSEYLYDRIDAKTKHKTIEKLGDGFITSKFSAANHDLVLACGPDAFLKVIAKDCVDRNVPSFISMDKHMACGVGACLVCVCKTVSGNKRCCVDGPVFRGEELVL